MDEALYSDGRSNTSLHYYYCSDLIWIFPYLHFRTTWLAVLLNCNILKSDFRIKRFSNKPTTLVIYYYRIKHFLPLVSKVGLLFVLFFFCSSGVFFPPCIHFAPLTNFSPSFLVRKKSSGSEKWTRGGKNLPLNRKTSLRKGPLFSTRDEITHNLF